MRQHGSRGELIDSGESYSVNAVDSRLFRSVVIAATALPLRIRIRLAVR
jgi:hypothetical protein